MELPGARTSERNFASSRFLFILYKQQVKLKRGCGGSLHCVPARFPLYLDIGYKVVNDDRKE